MGSQLKAFSTSAFSSKALFMHGSRKYLYVLVRKKQSHSEQSDSNKTITLVNGNAAFSLAEEDEGSLPATDASVTNTDVMDYRNKT